jgi:hypothetical protein
MADFHTLIARAIASLPDPTLDARQSVYERARKALEHQLGAMEPPLSDSEFARQRLNLDEAINRSEADVALRAVMSKMDQMGIPQDVPPITVPERSIVVEPEAQDLPEADASIPPSNIGLSAPRERPRMDTRSSSIDSGDRRRAIILGSVLGVIILGIGAIAFLSRDQKPKIVTAETPASSRTADADSKFDDRVGGASQSAEPRPNRATAEPRRPEGQQATQGQGASRAEVSVAQRAFMFEEAEAGGQEPKAFGGRAIWRLDTVNDGQGQPSETAIRADLDLADSGLMMTFVIRRNVDASLPASHLVQMSFTRSGNAQDRSVRDVAVPQFKTDESARGTPLSGLVVPVTENVFLVGLANLPVEVTRNVEMMRTRSWIDVPIRYANGKRAMISFEKGASGDRVIAEALDLWR